MRTSNPVLNDKLFARQAQAAPASGVMTVGGAVNKTLLLLLMAALGAAVTWKMVYAGGQVVPWMIGGVIGGLIFAMATIFKPTWAPVTAPLYAAAEGLFLGAISAAFNALYPDIVVQAVGLTFGTLLVLLVAYRAGVLRATPAFTRGIVAATGGIFMVYLISMVLRLFGVQFPFIHGTGMIGIGFSLFVVVIAALNLVLDFDLIERGARAGAPKFMEWFGAFALMVTLVWLYIEILILLAKLRER